MPRLGETPLYVGIDPGTGGGLSFIQGSFAQACRMPDSEQEVWDWVNLRSEPFGNRAYAVIERVQGYIGGGGHPGSSMFKFGQSYGSLRMALIAARIQFVAVTPQEWQKSLGIGTRVKGEKDTSFKNRLKVRAQDLFPNLKVTLATADALLIAEYCRRRYQRS